MIHCVTHNMFILHCVEMGPGRIALLTAKNGCAQCGAWTLCTGDTVCCFIGMMPFVLVRNMDGGAMLTFDSAIVACEGQCRVTSFEWCMAFC